MLDPGIIPVLVAPQREFRGLSSLVSLEVPEGDQLGATAAGAPVTKTMRRWGLSKALDECFPTDAHLVAYNVTRSDGEVLGRCPRLTKDVLPLVLEAGYRVEMGLLCFDYDLRDSTGAKMAWSDLPKGRVQEEKERILFAATHVDLPSNVIYATRHGARVIHVLAIPQPAGPSWGAAYDSVMRRYAAAGCNYDRTGKGAAACGDWTRLFRLPRVCIPDGPETHTKTWAEDWFWSREDWTEYGYLDVPESKVQVFMSATTKPQSPRPDPDAARTLIETMVGPSEWRYTEAGKEARKALAGAGCFAAAFEGQMLAEPGERHNKLLSAAGEVVARIYGFPWASAEVAYGILVTSAQLLGPDEDWSGRLWEMISTFWSREERKTEHRLAEAKARLEKAVAPGSRTRADFLAGVRDWLPGAAAQSDEDLIGRLRTEKLGILIDRARDKYRVLLSSGYYDPNPIGLLSLAKAVKESGMEWLIPVEYEKETKRGIVVVPKPPKNIVEDDARTFYKVDFSLRRKNSFLEFDAEGRGIFCHVPFHLRTDLGPNGRGEFSEEVDLLIRLLVGEENADELKSALACMLGIYEGPTAAISLSGAPSTGKKMLALALAECFTNEIAAPGEVIIDRFNDFLIQTPLVWVDEGVASSRGGKDFADAFRHLVTGGAITVEPKHLPKIQIAGVHRVVITANNIDTLLKIVGDRPRTEYDVSALTERIAHFDARPEAAEYLANPGRYLPKLPANTAGGLAFTRGWIRGDDGTPSRYLVASHLMWLYYNHLKWVDGRPVRLGKRLLYEGNTQRSWMIAEMRANAGATPEVACAINRLLSLKGGRGAVIEGAHVYFMQERVIEEAAQHSRTSRDELRCALRNLLDPDQPRDRFYVEGVRGRWRRIAVDKLRTVVEQHVPLHPSLELTPFGRIPSIETAP